MAYRPAGKHALAFILVTVLLDSMGIGIVMPVMPQLIMHLTGENLSRAAIYGGWMGFTYAAMQFVFAPVLGNLSDRFGRRPVLLYAVGSLGIDYIVMGLAPTITWLFVGRAVAGIAGASFSPAYAYIADVTPRDKRAQSFGLIGAAFGAGFILGPAIGGLLGEVGPRAPFFAAATLSLINFAYGTFVLPESLDPARRRAFDWRRANPVGAMVQVRRHPGVSGMLAALFLWQVAHQAMPSTWAYYTMFKFGWSEALVGASLAFTGALLAIGQSTLPRLVVPRLGEYRSALLGLAVGGTGFLGYALATRGWMMFAFQSTWLLGALVMPSMQALMSHRVPIDSQGELQGAVASQFSLASIIGPLVMTQLFRKFTSVDAALQFPGAPYVFAALLAAIAVAILATRTSARQPLAALLACAVLVVWTSAASAQAAGPSLPEGLYAEFATTKGTFVARLEPERAPLATASFVGLAEGTIANEAFDPGEPFYDGTAFHRVVPGHVIQAGAPASDRARGPGYSYPNEIHADLSHDHAGALGVANGGPHTNGSQFYVTLGDRSYLDGDYIVFGEVVEGMDVVLAIAQDDVVERVRIVRVGAAASAFRPDTASFEAMVERAEARVATDERMRDLDLRAWAVEQAPDAIWIESGADSRPAAPVTASYRGRALRWLAHLRGYQGPELVEVPFVSGADGSPCACASPERFEVAVDATNVTPGIAALLATLRPGETRWALLGPEAAFGSSGFYAPDVPGVARFFIPPQAPLLIEVTRHR